jgi:hypothetical protein
MIELRLMTRPQPDRSRAQERPFEIRIDNGVPVGFGELFDVAANIDAGVVDQDVDRSQLFFNRCDEAIDVSCDGDVGGKSLRAPTRRRSDLCRRLLRRRQRTPGQRHVRAHLRQRRRHRQTQPTRAASNKRNFPVEPKRIEYRCVSHVDCRMRIGDCRLKLVIADCRFIADLLPICRLKSR